MKKKWLMRMTAVLMSFAMLVATVYVPGGIAVYGASEPIKILEVQPGGTRDIDNGTAGAVTYKLNAKAGYELTQMTMNRFVSSIDDINGKYDVVYIGENSGVYATTGPYLYASFQGTREYGSCIDITNRRAQTLSDFVNSGQLAVFTDSIFTTKNGAAETNLSKLYKSNSNIIKVASSISSDKLYETITAEYAKHTKRPTLTISTKPVDYAGVGTLLTGHTMSFQFDIANQEDHKMDVQLYVDQSGDGIFKNVVDAGTGQVIKQELIDTKTGLVNSANQTINWIVPSQYNGMLPWKLVVRDTVTGAQNYAVGFPAYKSPVKSIIKVLHLYPTGNTFALSKKDKNGNEVGDMVVNGTNILSTDEYNIQITTLDVKDYDNAPTVLNGKYDMVVLGFADTYGNADDDITNATAVKYLNDFINSGQSVLFTHDTFTFQVSGNTGWGRNLTRNFRDVMGQNIYVGKTPSPMQYGFSWITLARSKTGALPTTTNAKKLNDALVTKYPYVLGDIGVSTTHHQYFQLNLEDESVVPFFTLSGSGFDSNDGRNDYYMYSRGNITYSGTGHSKPGSYLTEKQLFVNTMVKAIRGANSAPEVLISEISDNQCVNGNAAGGVNFKYAASDGDGDPMTVKIYANTQDAGATDNPTNYVLMKSYGTAEVKNGVLQPETLKFTGLAQDQLFRIKVVATDSRNASGEKIVVLKNQTPKVSMTSEVGSGYLVGDKATVTYKVAAEGVSSPKLFTTVNQAMNSSSEKGLSATVASPWAVSTDVATKDQVYCPVSTGNNSYSLAVALNKAGSYTVNNSFMYDTGYAKNITEVGGSYMLDVKNGSVTVQIQDSSNNNSGVPNIPITLINKSTGQKYTVNTGSTGIAEMINGGSYKPNESFVLPTGTYTVHAALSDTYKQDNPVGDAEITLDYKNSSQTVTFKVKPVEKITNVKLTNYAGASDVYLVSGGSAKVKLSFDLNVDCSSLTLDLESIIAALDGKVTFKSGNPSADFTVSNNKVVFSGTVPKGSKTVDLILWVDRSVPNGVYSNGVAVTRVNDQSIANSGLNVHVLEKPRIE